MEWLLYVLTFLAGSTLGAMFMAMLQVERARRSFDDQD